MKPLLRMDTIFFDRREQTLLTFVHEDYMTNIYFGIFGRVGTLFVQVKSVSQIAVCSRLRALLRQARCQGQEFQSPNCATAALGAAAARHFKYRFALLQKSGGLQQQWTAVGET